MDRKQYTIDNVPVSASDLINAARALDINYGAWSGILTTREAAQVLRDKGHTVGYNPEYKLSD